MQRDLFDTGGLFSELFSTQPLSGKSKVRWKSREDLERDLSYFLGIKDKHICVDGPSGSGKTSLVQHIFVRQRVPFIHIQVSKDWNWPDFTRQFVEIPEITKRGSETSIKGFLNFFRPGIEGGLTLKDEFDENASFDLLIKRANAWKSSDLAQWIHNNKVVLIVDDLEMASDSILDGLAACSKLLGQSYSGKIVFIGIDDIMRKIVARNESLSRRISEVSVGGLSGVGESSSFIFDKFKSAKIVTPDRDESVTKQEEIFCRKLIYDAANGLMKDLNDLGMNLARRSVGRKRLTVTDFKEVCMTFLQDYRRKNRRRVITISEVVKDNTGYASVFSYLISKSASSITKVAEVEEVLCDKLGYEEIAAALDFLNSKGIIALTGAEEARIFFRDPPLFNCIRTHLHSGANYGWDLNTDSATIGGFGQLSLGL